MLRVVPDYDDEHYEASTPPKSSTLPALLHHEEHPHQGGLLSKNSPFRNCGLSSECIAEPWRLDNFLMTTSDVYFTDDMESLVLNYNSLVGLEFVLSDDSVTIARN